MKTLKFALIAMFLATAIVNQAATDGFKPKAKKTVYMTFDRAIKDSQLVLAIYQQVDPEFLNTIKQSYMVEVDYHGIIYRILGSRQNWIGFFRPRPGHSVKVKIDGGNSN